jgi:hypothetical protein
VKSSCGKMWGLWEIIVGNCGEMWENVGFVARPHALRNLGNSGNIEEKKNHCTRKVGICVKISVCCWG